MAIKPDGLLCSIREQIIEDAVTGLTFQFERRPDGGCSFRLYGNLPFGNRDFSFSADGENTGAGTLLQGLCKPSWLTVVDELPDPPESQQ